MDISLKKFGLFVNKSFSFKQITIFYGGNESGKTTIFDAIVSSLIKVSGTTVYGKKVNARYQKDKSVQSSIPSYSLSAPSFLHTYAIREGNVQFNLDEDKNKNEVIQVIQNSLFDTGFDPKKLKERCLEFSEKTGNRRAAKNYKSLKESLDKAGADFFKTDQERMNSLKEWSSIPDLEIKKQNLEVELKKIEESLLQTNARYEILEKKETLSTLDKLYASILLWEDKFKNISYLKKLLESNSETALTSSEKKSTELSFEIKSLKNASEEKEKKITSLSLEKQEADKKFNSLSAFESMARSFEKRLDEILSATIVKTEIVWQIPYIVASISVSLIGFITSILSANNGFSVTPLFIGGLLLVLTGGLVFLLFGKKTNIKKDEESLNAHVKYLSEDMILQTKETIRPILATKDGIREALKDYFSHLESERRQTQMKEDSLVSEKNLLTDISKKIRKLQEEWEETKTTVDEILKKSNSTSIEEYKEKIRSAKSILTEFSDLDSHLLQIAKEYQTKSIEELKLRTKDKLDHYEKENIPKDFSSDEKNEKSNLKLTIESKKKEKDAKSKEVHELQYSLASLVATSTERLNRILKEWEKSSTDLDKVKKDFDDAELNFAAYQNLAKVFGDMDANSGNQMQVLIESLGKRWNQLLSGNELKKLEWDDISKKPSSFDKRNELREFENLSTGTQELLSFALRLEYAKRMSGEEKIPWILLDEPFRHMDETRTGSAVNYCLDFLGKEEWNGVFFTFDSNLVKMIRENAKSKNLDCILHELT
ncbi:double-stranded DNA repair protein Rad50 [Leptospira kobayashii]|uniref:Double-stranded DNA repair protein Rad50 n=1 Tax=Leptospira kobayashii TaxID=1917830 RepID=A0ABN6KBI0_9LEPT|nr:AAA family ATPase [Leptospira kobayashii]BDA77619.1 double-stranded DNA repair protein Rad50 [Leptospira kobayashii]